MASTPQDERFMRQALALARRGLGRTSPNPVVGAVLVRNGRIVGKGWHKRAGGPHAEVFALRNTNAKGATLYVTMEPCSTWGKTPPCSEAVIAAGVKRVVVATLDPNPKHNGRGLALLHRTGIRVEAGLLSNEATAMNEAFNKWVTSGIPLVIAKAAMSLDGKIATRTGDSKWITSKAARREAHKLRSHVDAIMVGANTVIRDDPQLTVRHGVRSKQPWRVVVDGRGLCPLTAKLFKDAHCQRTVVLTTSRSSFRWRKELSQLGVQVHIIKGSKGHLNLRTALCALGKMDITSVLVEGGGELLGSFFDERLVDRVALFYAPIIIGGRNAITSVGGRGTSRVKNSRQLIDCRWRRIGKNEMLMEARVKK